MKKHAVDNIFFFGDTFLISAPLISSGFTNILQHHKRFARHISRNLKNNTLSEKYLDYYYSETEDMNRNIQLIIGAIFLNAKPAQKDVFVDAIKALPNSILVSMIFLRLNIRQFVLVIEKLVKHMGLRELAGILPKEEYLFLAEEAAKIFEELTVEEAESIFHKHGKAI